MAPRAERTMMKALSLVVVISFLTFQATCFLPRNAHAGPAEDLKQIEYKYYFRGNYEKAISELRAFLESEDLTQAQIVEAREYLAASLILSGGGEQGKAEFMQLLKMDGGYPGPDPSVFKAVIVTTYNEAKSEYASMVIRTAPEAATADKINDTPNGAAVADQEDKPLYKKWWFYATMAAVGLIIAGAASAGGDDAGGSTTDSGTVTVGIEVR